MSKMSEHAFNLEYGDFPFDEREMIDPPESYDPKYNKEAKVSHTDIDFVAEKILEEEKIYLRVRIKELLKKFYKTSDRLWSDYPEYFQAYQVEEGTNH